ncbi:MAG: hypothetical protein D6791_10755 [Chloroflexi bacterium]|nr:MAG: hypothetical protein D6791_10755 [Chloroflexota bacterium]
MNFPLENPFYQFVYHVMNTAGIGGLIVGVEALLIMVTVFFGLRHIAVGARADEPETYAYPTPALHHHVGHE